MYYCFSNILYIFILIASCNFQRELTTIIARVALDPNEVCSIALRGCGQSVNPLHNWTVPLTPFPKPPVIQPLPPKVNNNFMLQLHLYYVFFLTFLFVSGYNFLSDNFHKACCPCCMGSRGHSKTNFDSSWGLDRVRDWIALSPIVANLICKSLAISELENSIGSTFGKWDREDG